MRVTSGFSFQLAGDALTVTLKLFFPSSQTLSKTEHHQAYLNVVLVKLCSFIIKPSEAVSSGAHGEG